MNEDDQIQQEISALGDDIINIETELEQLSNNESLLRQEVTKLEQLEAEQTQPPVDGPHDEVLMIKHTYFDPSISHFFETTEETSSTSSSSQLQLINQRIMESTDVKENIMYENILRMSGITAFPINNKHLFPNDEILGVRFDIFSYKSKSYKQPHYVILLKRKDKSDTPYWSVYKTTLPMYAPLNEYQQELQQTSDLDKFVTRIHMYIAKDNEKRGV
ncbi:MCM21 [Candida margitis]|uniref:MCM21 n=1 Tax=Candida margitis TaxID=1775924 RepID=UPI002227EA01|nr:MCM21 [Candida margitis]KAI5952194.1 MCM21 [Candida margitis]